MQKFTSKVSYALAAAALLAPSIAFAQVGFDQGSQFSTTLRNLLGLINTTILPLLVAIAVAIFFYGIVKYIFSTAQEGKAGSLAIVRAGLIGLVVMLSLWGIVFFISASLGINGTASLSTPKIDSGTVHN